MQLPRALLGQAQKIKKNPPLKKFLYFRKGKPLKSFFSFGKWNFSSQARKVKKVRSPLENSLYSKLIFQEVTFRAQKMKKKKKKKKKH